MSETLTPNTCAGFVAGHVAQHGTVPPAQAIWDAAVRSARERYEPTPRASDASTVRTDNFGLDAGSMQRLLDACMKPEEIAGTIDVQHERVAELVSWFVRHIGGGANPKWTAVHAYELAYYIASNGINRAIDMRESKQAAYMEGVNISAGDRGILERLNVIKPTTSCDRPPAGWTCSRAKDHYGPCAATQEEVKA